MTSGRLAVDVLVDNGLYARHICHRHFQTAMLFRNWQRIDGFGC